MRRKLFLTMAPLLFLLLRVFALAAPKSQVVYVKYPKTPFRSDTSLNAKVQLLSSGQEVTWLGPDEKQPQWQKVQYQGSLGYVALSNLSKKPPMKELIVSSNGSVSSMDTQSFSKSSAAAKALGEGALTYADAKDQSLVAVQVFTTEVISKKIKAEETRDHAKKNDLTTHQGAGQ